MKLTWFLAAMACTKHKKFDGLTTNRTRVTGYIDIPSCNSNIQKMQYWLMMPCVRVYRCTGAFTDSSLTPAAVESTTVLFSVSRAWRLGSAVLSARAEKRCPIAAILQQEGGKLLFNAKVCRRLLCGQGHVVFRRCT